MNVLFVCSGNTCRSPMAEAIFRALSEERRLSIRAKSAGLGAFWGEPAAENAVAALSEWEIDLTAHRSQPLTEALLREADLVFPMTAAQKQALDGVHPHVVLLDAAGISDPFGGDLAAYQTCRDQIRAALLKKFDEGFFREH